MPSLRRRLKSLLAADPADAAVILAGTLPYAESEEVDELARAAIATRRVVAWAAVIRVLDRLTGPTRRRLADADGPLDRALARARDGTPRVDRNIVRLVALRGDPALAAHAADHLGDREIGETAAQALLSITQQGLAKPIAAAASAALDETLASVARADRDHHHFPVVLAIALWERRAGGVLAAALDDRDAPVHRALRRLPETGDAFVRGELLRWLGRPRLASGVTRSLHLIKGDGHGDVLAQGHLLLAPTRRRPLRRVFRPLRCVPAPAAVAALPARAQPAVVRYVMGLDLAPATRMRLLTDLVVLPAPVARWRLVEALETLPARRTTPLLERLLNDRSRVVARAAWRLQRVRANRGSNAAARSPHRSIRRQVAVLQTREDTRFLAAAGDLLSTAEWRAAAVCGLGRDRGAWLDQLARWLEGRDPELQRRAATLAARHRLVRALDATLVEAAEQGDPRLMSTVAACLADSARPSITRVLVGWLDHPDARVRANTLETLGARDQLLALDHAAPRLDDAHNRIRANAIRVVGRSEPDRAAEAARSMLRDPRPLHRVSAVWVATRLRQPCLAPDLRSIAHRDPRPELRLRALRAQARVETAIPRRVLEAVR